MGDKRLVVVGYGMGAYHSNLIDKVDGLKLHGVCDILPEKRERAAREHPGIKTYPEIGAVLADGEVDVVVVVTPHDLHAEMAIAAMNAGKHAVTDKALCLSVRQAREMVAARDRNGVLLTTFHNRRWDSDYLTVKRVLDAGLLGPICHIQSCTTFWGLGQGTWRSERARMGGWMFDWGAHTVDQILSLTQSRPKHVYAFDHYRATDPNEVEDYVNCTITFEDGLTATTVVGYLNKLPMYRWYVMGEKGTLTGEDFDKPLKVKTTVAGLEAEMSFPLVKGDWVSFYENLRDALNGKGELAVKPEQLLPQIAIAEAAYRSIRDEQVVPVEKV